MTKSFNPRHRPVWETPTVRPVRHRSTVTDLGWSLVAVACGIAAGLVGFVCYALSGAL